MPPVRGNGSGRRFYGEMLWPATHVSQGNPRNHKNARSWCSRNCQERHADGQRRLSKRTKHSIECWNLMELKQETESTAFYRNRRKTLERGKPYAHLNDGYAYGGWFLQGRIFADRCIYLDKQHFQGERRRCSLDWNTPCLCYGRYYLLWPLLPESFCCGKARRRDVWIFIETVVWKTVHLVLAQTLLIRFLLR